MAYIQVTSICWLIVLGSFVGSCWVAPDESLLRQETKDSKQETDTEPDWAQQFIKANPLENLSDEQVKLKPLLEALQKSNDSASLARHFRRAKLTKEEIQTFLESALELRSYELSMAAVDRLKEQESLDEFIDEKLVDWKPLPTQLAANIHAKDDLRDRKPARPAELQKELVELAKQLRSDDESSRYFAAARFRSLGIKSIPVLLSLLKDKDPQVRNLAAFLLADIVEADKRRQTRSKISKSIDATTVPPPKSGVGANQGPRTARLPSEDTPFTVRVFFGTNRKISETATGSDWQLWGLPVVFCVLLFGFLACFHRSSNKQKLLLGCGPILTSLVLLLALLVTGWIWNSAVQQYWSRHLGVRFEPVRDAPDTIHFGECLVSLPPNHVSGELERPWLGPENEQKHVVLKQTSTMEESEFYQAIKKELETLPISSRDCFVFVHGFNVTFESAARRTAQISYDLKESGKFEGVPIFYSWPSAGSPILYSWDRAEIRNSKAYVKKFLQGVAANVDADKIHVVAHSMGADLVGQAISDIDAQGALFHQVVLAAPDIDRDVFRQEIAPALAKNSVRTTMYCSSNDFALQISYQFNNARRAGDTNGGVFVMDGIDTIDASEFRTDLLGHSYYGDCVPLAEDIAVLMKRNASPNSDDRKLLPRPWKSLFYWVFSRG